MDTVSKYNQYYPSDRAILIGGSACYYWIYIKLGIQIPMKDIDIHITTEDSIDEVIDRFITILPGYHMKSKDEEIATLVGNSANDISYDIFINQYEVSDNLSIQSIDSLIHEHKATILMMEEDLLYIEDSTNDEYQYILLKLNRMKDRFALLKQF